MNSNVTSVRRSLHQKKNVYDHIRYMHYKCSLFARIFPTIKFFELHEIAVHKKGILKYKIEKDPSIKNLKNKRNN